MTFHLVTASDINLRSNLKKNIFLGKWCVSFSERKKKDLVFVKSLPINTEILDKDNNLIIKLTKNISSEIYKLLNEFHRENFDNRQWNIMLGIWLHKCISLILNRYNILKYSIKNYEILSTTVYKSQNYDLSCKNVNNFSIICNNGTWNNILFSKI